jgi:hypothetical protein
VSDRQLIIKFKPGSGDLNDEVADRLNHIVGDAFFSDVHPLFPGDTDAEMSSVYIAHVPGTSDLSSVLHLLNESSEIEYAHFPAERRGS